MFLSMKFSARVAIILCLVISTYAKSVEATNRDSESGWKNLLLKGPTPQSISDRDFSAAIANTECKCKNGYCEEKDGDISCQCPYEWGHHMPDTCYKCDCGSGHSCKFSGFFATEKTCLCREGYEDAWGMCKGTCNKNPCKNGGECKVVGSEIECKCKELFSGWYCEDEHCLLNPCKNGGQCLVKENGTKRCICKAPYNGDLCESDTPVILTTLPYPVKTLGSLSTTPPTIRDSCDENPCQNGGTCIPFGKRFKCKCKESFSGTLCEIDPCAKTPCENDGICKVVEGEVKCSCIEPFFGKFCESRYDTCLWNLCKNGGICITTGGTMECFCKAPFYGEFCESRSVTELYRTVIISVLAFGLLIVVLTFAFCILRQRASNAKLV